MEFHLALGGMDVHVHGGGINFQKQAADRVTALHQRCVITFDERIIDAAILDRAAVDENELAIARRARDAGRADQTPNFDLRISDLRFRIFPARRSRKYRFRPARKDCHRLPAWRKNSRTKAFRRQAARVSVRAGLRCGWRWPRRI